MDRQTVVQDLVRLAKELTSQDDPEDAMMDLVGAQGTRRCDNGQTEGLSDALQDCPGCREEE